MHFSGLCLNSNEQEVSESICRNGRGESCEVGALHILFFFSPNLRRILGCTWNTEALGHPASPPPRGLRPVAFISPEPARCPSQTSPGP